MTHADVEPGNGCPGWLKPDRHRLKPAATVRSELRQLSAAGRVRRVRLPRTPHGPQPGDGWELI